MKNTIAAIMLLVAIPAANANGWSATFECEHNHLATVIVYKGIVSWGMDEEADFDKGPIERTFRWDPDKVDALTVNGKPCRKLSDEEKDKLPNQMEKEIRGVSDGDQKDH
jgi:hypothetical protein